MSVIASQEFYRSPIFWAAAAVVAAVVIGVGTMWATLRAANPKRSIQYAMEETRLFQPHEHLDGAMELRRNGVLLTDPRIVRVRIRNNGRRDVSANDFDGAQPIQACFGVPVLELLSSGSQPSTSHTPAAIVSGNELRIGPGRFGKATETSYVVLIDGPPAFEMRHSLLNVPMREGITLGFASRLLTQVVYPVAGAGAALLIIILGAPFT
jgi:hypothetical protein